MKITLLEIANFKRLKALRLEPGENGLTVIGGKNGQGKTSVLDGIAFALGGAKHQPTNMKREGAVGDMVLHIETDNGLIIERKGKNGSLSVTDKDGKRAGQTLLNAFISELSIDLPKFHNASSKDKASMLLKSLGIEEELAKFDKAEKTAYDKRTLVGQEADRKKKHAGEMPYYDDMPAEEQSVSDLVKEQQEILSRNGVKENAKRQLERSKQLLSQHKAQIETLKEQMATIQASIETLEKSIADGEDKDYDLEPTDEIEAKIANFEETNRKIRANNERQAVLADADLLQDQYDSLTCEIEKIRADRLKLLESAKFPLDGLTVENGVLLFNGKAWDCMSGSQQLIVDTAIASSLNPECKFVLLDKLEQLDLDTLADFDKWLTEKDLQCIATRVSTGDECTIVIEDGESEAGEGTVVVPKKPKKEDDADDWD